MDYRSSHHTLDDTKVAHLLQEAVSLRSRQTFREALKELREATVQKRIVYFYVVDDDGHLIGTIPTRALLLGAPDDLIGEATRSDVVSLPLDATLREAGELMLKHRFLALPVLDSQGRLAGVADLSSFGSELEEISQHEQFDNVFQLIGVHLTLHSTGGLWPYFRERFAWLLCNVGGGLLAAWIASRYEALLQAAVVLALFIPVVLAVSESVSIQSMTITLQSLNRGRPDWSVLRRILLIEFRVASLLGASLGLLIGLIIWAWQQAPQVALAAGLTIYLAVLTAGIFGVLLPLCVSALRGDPRIAAGPIVLALTDMCALLFYLNLSGRILGLH